LLALTVALSGCGGGIAVPAGEQNGAVDEDVRALDDDVTAEPPIAPEVVDVPDGIESPDVVDLPPEGSTCAEGCAWSEKAAMPTASWGQAAVEHDGLLYVFGGDTAADRIATTQGSAVERYARELPPLYSSVRAYDPATNTWTNKASMPRGLFVLTANVIADKVYVFGGYGENQFDASVQEYDPASDSWQLREPMPTVRYTFSSEAIDGKVYVVGGYGPEGLVEGDAARVEIFEPNDGWTSGSPMPRPVIGAASCSMGPRMFVFGGDINNFTSIYDVESDAWSRGSPPPSERGGHTCIRIGEAFYLLGGRSTDGEPLDLVEKYDPGLDTWTTFGHMPLPRTFLSALALDRDAYVIGGIIPGDAPTAPITDRLDVLHVAP
jgi:hypothetical protein